MFEPLPRWIMKRDPTLWNKFKNKEFAHKIGLKTKKISTKPIS